MVRRNIYRTIRDLLVEYLNYVYKHSRGSVVTVSLKKFRRFIIETQETVYVIDKTLISKVPTVWFTFMDIINACRSAVYMSIDRRSDRVIVLYRKCIPQIIEELRRRQR